MNEIVDVVPATVESVFIFTRSGYVKKMNIEGNDDFREIRPSGIKYIDLKGDDSRVVSVVPARGNQPLIAVSEDGKGICFSPEELRSMSRSARGVIAKKGEPLAGATQAGDDQFLLLQGKSTCGAIRTGNLDQQNRGGKGRYLIKATGQDQIHTVRITNEPRAVSGDTLREFTSRSKLGGHGARQNIDHFFTEENWTSE